MKSLLLGYEIRSTAIISNGLVHRVPKRQSLILMRKDLQKLQNRVKLTSSETNSLWQESYGRYMRLSKSTFSALRKANNAQKGTKDYQVELDLRKNIVYEKVRNEFGRLEHEKKSAADQIEYRAKRDDLHQLFASGVFYLCSTHAKPAQDHADWEGKIYVSGDWRNRIDQDMHGKIEAYIRNHDVKTVEWVTGEPVYLVTRPNCKHYFIELGVEEVLGTGLKTLLRRHEMYMPEDLPMSYEYGQYKGYYERLKTLEYLHQMFDAKNMKKDIAETRALVRKWGNRAKAGRE